MSSICLIDNYDELLILINDYLNPKNNRKKQAGEVFTPFELIKEMLEKLPNEVWYNVNYKWIDFSSGIGNFIICVFYKLMETLSEIIKDEKLRKKHIIENMLYMCELDKENVELTKKIFNSNNEYKLNIYQGNSLDLNYKQYFGCNKFNVIIGNPPYQKENKKNNNARGGTNNNLYIDFIKKAFELLEKDAFLVFIHPLNWRKIGSQVFDDYIKRNIHFIKLNYGGQFFKNVSVKTDYYVLKNSQEKNYLSTIQYIDNNKLYSSSCVLNKELKFIPNIYNQQINSILNKINIYGKQYECIISSYCHKVRPHVNKGKDNIFKYQLYNTSGNPYEYFSSKPHKDQYKKKVVLSNSGKLKPFYDNGTIGTTQDSMYIVVSDENEGKIIIDAIKSKLFSFLINICQWGNFRNEAKLFSYFKYPDAQNFNGDIYQYYKLTQDEINFIEGKQNINFNDINTNFDFIDNLLNEVKKIKKIKKINNLSNVLDV